jgi:hypothetical protein
MKSFAYFHLQYTHTINVNEYLFMVFIFKQHNQLCFKFYETTFFIKTTQKILTVIK